MFYFFCFSKQRPKRLYQFTRTNNVIFYQCSTLMILFSLHNVQTRIVHTFKEHRDIRHLNVVSPSVF